MYISKLNLFICKYIKITKELNCTKNQEKKK